MKSFLSKNQLIAITFLITSWLGICILSIVLLNTPIYIKNLGNTLEQNGNFVNSISVSGNGKVIVQPDMATISLSVSELANTSQDALSKANEKINAITEIVLQNQVNSSDIKTTQFNISAEYDYSTFSQTPKLKGQRATIGISVDIKNIDSKAAKATKIIDELSTIDTIQIGSIYFDLEDKQSAYLKAREIAFKEAEAKAQQLARLSNVRLLKPVSINDSSSSFVVQRDIMPLSSLEAPALQDKSTTIISPGEMELSISLNVLFGIE